MFIIYLQYRTVSSDVTSRERYADIEKFNLSLTACIDK